MMAKITKGSDFKGVVDYIIDKNKNTQIVAHDGLFMENKDTIAMSFNTQSQMNNKVSKPVGHIALSFSKEDEPRLTNRVMARLNTWSGWASVTRSSSLPGTSTRSIRTCISRITESTTTATPFRTGTSDCAVAVFARS
jgi:hypothetical protein